jgi:hypothetical protein
MVSRHRRSFESGNICLACLMRPQYTSQRLRSLYDNKIERRAASSLDSICPLQKKCLPSTRINPIDVVGIAPYTTVLVCRKLVDWTLPIARGASGTSLLSVSEVSLIWLTEGVNSIPAAGALIVNASSLASASLAICRIKALDSAANLHLTRIACLY